ncbi:hypothetical protein RclHR1_01020029 [Rhizophagus clarus]|uniref:Uncharacterized protein n=1 Tax=Rhizophagus clarus TaxID=94130 RepID=A0A2Z6QRX3_9GLOM|nr:hypothetical protein RclHR1_01020029 [Rhizophagus clarus]GES76522.1 hypothetical protein GLOIN_2v1473868 [Rhizophagus clarus]
MNKEVTSQLGEELNENKSNNENNSSNSEEKMLDDSDDDGYSRYNKYEYDRGYYYYDEKYEMKTSSMISFIISLITV